MISGPRVARPMGWRRLLAGTLAQELEVFVVPGPEILDASCLDVGAAGLRLVANPRHASVLLLVGEIPPELARAAAITYAQMPRPRAILAIGTGSPASLPTADVTVEPDQAALVAGVHDVRRRLATGAWAVDAPPFVVEGGRESPREAAPAGTKQGEMLQMNHLHTGAAEHREMAGMSHEPMTGMAHGHTGAMAHGHVGRGFMSMVMMTRDLPRSADGLPMERLEVPFGPLHPGLPGGLNLLLTLDGDTVSRAELRQGTLKRDLPSAWLGSAARFVEQLARLDPLAPQAYRVLALRALEQASGIVIDEREAGRRVALLERERAVSHLIWLGRFGFLLGDAWLAERSAAFARQLARAHEVPGVTKLRNHIGTFLTLVRRTPLLRRRLADVGAVAAAEPGSLQGPVARACGRTEDARALDPAYQQVAFEPLVDEGGDARARCWLRLAEIEQSLEMVLAASADLAPSPPVARSVSGYGQAVVETARGKASITATLADGHITDVELTTPSSAHLSLVEQIAVGRELSDALVGVASLDLSPWELDG